MTDEVGDQVQEPAGPAAAAAGDRALGPLAGLRVLDVSRVLSGPFATMVLGDLGADVLKVEQPGVGDDTRQWGPPYQGTESAYFLSVNRNKRSVTLDLRDPAGRQAIVKFAETADVVVENFRPGTAERLGISYGELAKVNPRLVYVSISGYGQTGPLRNEPGYDAIAQARSGMMSLTGEPGGLPVRSGISIADLGAGMWALVGILVALRVRDRLDQGQWVDISLLDGQIAWLTYTASGYFATGRPPSRLGTAHPTIVPYQAFPTKDGQIMLAVGNDSLWQRFVSVLGSPEPLRDERFATNPGRVRSRASLVPIVAAFLLERTTEEWLDDLCGSGIPAGPIYDLGQALTQAQVVDREMVTRMDHPTVGDVYAVASPLKFSMSGLVPPTPAPLLGQHTEEVLLEHGFSASDVDALRARGVLG